MFDYGLSVNVQDLMVFYHVVEKGGYLRASEALNMDQGKVSRCVARLEDAFNADLLYSNMRTVRPTPTGVIAFNMSKEILECTNRARLEAEREHTAMSGPITLWATHGFGSYWLIPQLGPFLEEHGNISLNLKTDENQLHPINLTMGVAGIAIVTTRPQCREALACHLLCEYPLHIYASEDYLARHGTPYCVDDLDHHKIIGWRDNVHESVNSSLFNTLLYVGRDTLPPRKAFMRLENDMTMISSATKGLGLVFMPAFFGESSPNLRRVALQDEERLLQGRMHKKHIVYPKSMEKSARHRAMIDFIRERAAHMFTKTNEQGA